MDKSARILVVDDNESVRKILETVLEYVGYAVDTAKTGGEALKKAKAKIYNLAIVDYSLLDMELLVFLKRIERMAPTTQIIVVADKPSLPEVMEKIGRKPYQYLLKPFEMETLLAIIRRQLRKQRWKKRSRKIATEFIKPLEKHL
jgi:DNA-binding NtrC family response regulator